MKNSMNMKSTLGLVGALVLASASSATGAAEAEHLAMARVRLTTEPSVARSCTRLGQVSDDSVKDLRRKIVRAGGGPRRADFQHRQPVDHPRPGLPVSRARPRGAAAEPADAGAPGSAAAREALSK